MTSTWVILIPPKTGNLKCHPSYNFPEKQPPPPVIRNDPDLFAGPEKKIRDQSCKTRLVFGKLYLFQLPLFEIMTGLISSPFYFIYFFSGGKSFFLNVHEYVKFV